MMMNFLREEVFVGSFLLAVAPSSAQTAVAQTAGLRADTEGTRDRHVPCCGMLSGRILVPLPAPPQQVGRAKRPHLARRMVVR